MRPNQNRGVAAYLLFTVALSSVFYFLIAKSGRAGGGWGAYIGCLVWCPGVAALLSCKYLGRDLSTLGWKWGKTRYEIACYLIPLGYPRLLSEHPQLHPYAGENDAHLYQRLQRLCPHPKFKWGSGIHLPALFRYSANLSE
jgi:hypothetical protein